MTFDDLSRYGINVVWKDDPICMRVIFRFHKDTRKYMKIVSYRERQNSSPEAFEDDICKEALRYFTDTE